MGYSLHMEANGSTLDHDSLEMTYNMRPLLDFLFSEGGQVYWLDVPSGTLVSQNRESPICQIHRVVRFTELLDSQSC